MSLRSRTTMVFFHPPALAAILTILGVPGCYDDSRATVDCGDKVCPDGWYCYKPTPDAGADRYQCLRCGNGTVDGSEKCDDGKETATCNLDFAHPNSLTNCSITKCGDGYVNTTAGEVCDDGQETATCNLATDPNLKTNCTSAKCGDGYLNTKAGEGCDKGSETAECNLDRNQPGLPTNCTVTKCGDGYVNRIAGETCDYGDTTDGDGCSALCRWENCGNGVKDAAEQCDDGALDNTGNLQPRDSARCNRDCTLATCGDGYLNKAAKEGCDDGRQTATCNLDLDRPDLHTNCTVTTCGDGYANSVAGETCDDGNVDNGDGCSAQCLLESCGNGVTNTGEDCDQGALDNTGKPQPRDTPECDSNCTVPRCGDGYLNKAAGELCDDGTQTPNCNFAADNPKLMTNCTVARCGDGYVNKQSGETCDDGKLDDRGNAIDTNTCNSNCTAPQCGDGHLNKATGEVCDGGKMDAAGHPLQQDTETCNRDCTATKCGDGYVNKEAGEACDDGNAIDGDGCSSRCTLESCGNGTLDSGEECDDGNADSSDFCVGNCRIQRCGDGYRFAGKEALHIDLATGKPVTDWGSNSLPDGGTIEDAGSEPNWFLVSVEQCDGKGVNTSDCNANCTAPICGDHIVNGEVVYTDATGSPRKGEECDEWSSPEARANTPTCNSDCTVPRCGDGRLNTKAEEDCDYSINDSENNNLNRCTYRCKFSTCGDGYINRIAGETCDDGNTTDGDGCSSQCHLEVCGNGVKDAHEDCDDGVLDTLSGQVQPQDTATCNRDCTFAKCGDGYLNKVKEACDDASESATCNLDLAHPDSQTNCTVTKCGDGYINMVAGETCDDGNTIGGDGCGPRCRLESCGDGVLDSGEECDDGNEYNTDTCTNTCRFQRCGDRYRFAGAGVSAPFPIAEEACDDGAMNTASCNWNCTQPHCGDGIVNANYTYTNAAKGTQFGEECDRWSTAATLTELDDTKICNHDCTIARCGDGYINKAAGEECDPPESTKDAGTVSCDANCHK